jgi:hypothetical protein
MGFSKPSLTDRKDREPHSVPHLAPFSKLVDHRQKARNQMASCEIVHIATQEHQLEDIGLANDDHVAKIWTPCLQNSHNKPLRLWFGLFSKNPRLRAFPAEMVHPVRIDKKGTSHTEVLATWLWTASSYIHDICRHALEAMACFHKAVQ